MKVSLWAEIRRLHEVQRLSQRAIAKRLHCCTKTVSNALAGRAEELITWDDYQRFAAYWRDQVANVRLHRTTGERPIDRFQRERPLLRPLPEVPFDTDEILAVVVTPHARIHYDGNRYSVPPELARKPVTLRADATYVETILWQRLLPPPETPRLFSRAESEDTPSTLHDIASLRKCAVTQVIWTISRE